MSNFYNYELNKTYVLTTDTINLVVSVDNIKDYLRLDSDYDIEDDLIEELIKTSTRFVENYTGRELITKTYTMYMDFFPSCEIEICRHKIQSISSIKYYTNSILTTLDSSLYSFTKGDNFFQNIYLVNGVSFFPSTDDRKQAVEIVFTAGFGINESFVPDIFKTIIKRLVSYLYENRGDCILSLASLDKMPDLKMLMDQYNLNLSL